MSDDKRDEAAERTRAVLERVTAPQGRGPRGGRLERSGGVLYEVINGTRRRLDYQPKGKKARRALVAALEQSARTPPRKQ